MADGGPEVVIAIPAYREVATIGIVVDRCRAIAPKAILLVIDDGSDDCTAEIAEEHGADVIRNPANAGKGDALLRGMRHALALGASRIVTMDGDGQHRPEDLPLLLAASYYWPGHIVVGSRRASRNKAPRSRRMANRIADFWISWAARHPIEDTQSGYRVYPAQCLSHILGIRRLSPGFAFESELLIEAGRLGYQTVSVPIPAIYGSVLERRSHFRPGADIRRIVFMVAGKLTRRRMDPAGLWRSLRRPYLRYECEQRKAVLNG
ncbi:MAG: glycosyltransferase family 2 protein [Acetobacteraceae bacterium]|nr:glycosyltransferase family 2 protein [Acetobacteraceae bacterium]